MTCIAKEIVPDYVIRLDINNLASLILTSFEEAAKNPHCNIP